MSTTTDDDGVTKVAELINDIKIAMLTTEDTDGHLVSRPMAVQETEFDGDLWFFSDGSARKVGQIRHGAKVNVAFSSNDAWVSLAGTAEIVRDVQKQKQLWNRSLEAWFPDGPETADMVMVKIHAESAEYWDSPGGRVTTLLSFVKAKTKGERYSGGENEVVQL